jgi:Golgi nucleoside diphosphatase
MMGARRSFVVVELTQQPFAGRSSRNDGPGMMIKATSMMMIWMMGLVCCCWHGSVAVASSIPTTASSNNKNENGVPDKSSSSSPYWIIIDGGSTGSRLHVFEFVETTMTSPLRDGSNNNNNNTTENPEDKGLSETQLLCERRGSFRANVPLSSFADATQNASYVAEHLVPAFVQAAQLIPSMYYDTTPVYYQATAGMRLLTEHEQEAVYDALYEGLRAHPDFQFAKGLHRNNIQTLSGEQEGFYGAVAANYLQGTMDAHLNLIASSSASSNPFKGPIGALDMGGASTQIVFLPGKQHHQHDASENDDEDDQVPSCRAPWANTLDQDDSENDPMLTTCHTATHEELLLPSKLHGPDFFSTSYLSYGADQFRERLWNTWIAEHEERIRAEKDLCNAHLVIENPCTFPGYQIEWQGYTLLGTGDAEQCVRQVQRLLPHPHEPDHAPDAPQVGGVPHPPVRGKFFAMSLYFFTLDSLRELSGSTALNVSWPTPSIQELADALDGFCKRSWHDDLVHIQDTAHFYTRPEVLPHRCLESVYMVTLLRDGFGFPPESRDITFTFLVDGSEVEWTLGMALALRAAAVSQTEEQEQPETCSVFESSSVSQQQYEEEEPLPKQDVPPELLEYSVAEEATTTTVTKNRDNEHHDEEADDDRPPPQSNATAKRRQQPPSQRSWWEMASYRYQQLVS